MKCALFLLIAISLRTKVDARPSGIDNKIPPSSQVDLIKFFRDFGYLPTPPEDSETLYTEESITQTLKKVQKFGGLNETGEFDEETQKLLVLPRCGNPDLIDGEEIDSKSTRRRKKRYIIGAKGWKTRTLTYHLSNWSPKFKKKEYVTEQLRKAFDAWSAYSRLNFKEISDPNSADISIFFGRYNHGDRYPFDGPGYTLAHAYYPYSFGPLGGDIHFDEDENWGEGPDKLNLYTVAIHEIGHSLGLSHSPDRDSVMFAYYKGQSLTLGYDDILAMYELYITNGPPEEPTSARERASFTTSTEASTTQSLTTTSISNTERDPSSTVSYDQETSTHVQQVDIDAARDKDLEICNGEFDSIAVIRGEIFMFNGEYVWRFSRPGVLFDGYPVKIRQMFPNLPDGIKKIDAAYERPSDNKIVFFVGQKSYVFDGRHWRMGSTSSSLGILENIEKIDSIFVWGKNKKTYIFANDLYWRLTNDKEVDVGYPKSISKEWRGVPSNINSAITWTDGKTYFFKNEHFWLFNDESLQTERSYPHELSSRWLPHCRTA